MDNTIWLKLVKNKKNGQINTSFPKKKLPIPPDKLLDIKRLKIIVEDWE